MSDPGTSYRTRDEVQGVRQTRDPITQFKDKIIDAGLVNADELKKLDDEIKTLVDAATKFCKADKEIAVDELYTDVYSKNLDPLIRGLTPDQMHKHTSLNKAVNLWGDAMNECTHPGVEQQILEFYEYRILIKYIDERSMHQVLAFKILNFNKYFNNLQ